MQRHLFILFAVFCAPYVMAEGSLTTSMRQVTTQQVIETNGLLNPAQQPTLAAQVLGPITHIHTHVGAHVEQGDLLASIDPTEARLSVDQAKASIRELEAQIANQKRRVKRFEKLVSSDSLSESGYEDAKTGLTALESGLDRAQAALALAEHLLSKTQITAPIRGRIQEKMITQGDSVAPGTPLFKMVSEKPLVAELIVPEHVLQSLSIGDDVDVESPSLQNPVHVHINEIQPMIHPVTRTALARCTMPDTLQTYPGASVRAHIRLTAKVRNMLPLSAVLFDAQGAYVFVTAPDGSEANLRRIETGIRTEDAIEVCSGLEIQEHVLEHASSHLLQ